MSKPVPVGDRPLSLKMADRSSWQGGEIFLVDRRPVASTALGYTPAEPTAPARARKVTEFDPTATEVGGRVNAAADGVY